MDQVFTFDKSLQQRLQDYYTIFLEPIPFHDLKRQWACYLELTVDPAGWQAIWKIQRTTCQQLNIAFPSVVLVLVAALDFDELQAGVKVLAVQDDIHIPESHWVPLTQLWPTQEQDESVVLNLYETANVLDMLRFFYLNVLRPWDCEDDDNDRTVDWVSKHLEPRLRLYYDVKNGLVPRGVAEHLHSLLSEAKRLQGRREALQKLDDSSAETGEVDLLTNLYIRILEIRNEVNILENPMLRNAIIKKQQYELISINNTKNDNNGVWLIFEKGTPDDCLKFLNIIKTDYADQIVQFASHLSTVLESTDSSNDVFILNDSQPHTIKTIGALENGGTLKGINQNNIKSTILKSTAENIMLDCNGGEIIFENLTIEAFTAQCAMIVRHGTVKLINCKLIGNNENSTHQGIIVLAGGNLMIIDCDVSGFATAIVGNSGAKITIINSQIHDVNVGLKFYDHCQFNAEKTSIYNCHDYGICYYPGDDCVDDITTFQSINILPNVSTDLLAGKNNKKGDVLVNHKSQLQPRADLFSNPDLDLTIANPDAMDSENAQMNGSISG